MARTPNLIQGNVTPAQHHAQELFDKKLKQHGNVIEVLRDFIDKFDIANNETKVLLGNKKKVLTYPQLLEQTTLHHENTAYQEQAFDALKKGFCEIMSLVDEKLAPLLDTLLNNTEDVMYYQQQDIDKKDIIITDLTEKNDELNKQCVHNNLILARLENMLNFMVGQNYQYVLEEYEREIIIENNNLSDDKKLSLTQLNKLLDDKRWELLHEVFDRVENNPKFKDVLSVRLIDQLKLSHGLIEATEYVKMYDEGLSKGQEESPEESPTEESENDSGDEEEVVKVVEDTDPDQEEVFEKFK